jgi:hypothetical protein
MVTVGTVRTRFDDGSWVDVHDTIGTIPTVAEAPGTILRFRTKRDVTARLMPSAYAQRRGNSGR